MDLLVRTQTGSTTHKTAEREGRAPTLRTSKTTAPKVKTEETVSGCCLSSRTCKTSTFKAEAALEAEAALGVLPGATVATAVTAAWLRVRVTEATAVAAVTVASAAAEATEGTVGAAPTFRSSTDNNRSESR
jgi:hypothetical protein